ncbi:MAG: hypothetical protein ACTSWN_12880, partial [Promethearchaeota archaeon]
MMINKPILLPSKPPYKDYLIYTIPFVPHNMDYFFDIFLREVSMCRVQNSYYFREIGPRQRYYTSLQLMRLSGERDRINMTFMIFFQIESMQVKVIIRLPPIVKSKTMSFLLNKLIKAVENTDLQTIYAYHLVPIIEKVLAMLYPNYQSTVAPNQAVGGGGSSMMLAGTTERKINGGGIAKSILQATAKAVKIAEKVVETSFATGDGETRQSRVRDNKGELAEKKNIIQERLEKLNKMFKISHRLRIDDICGVLKMDRYELLDFYTEWADKFGFKIDGDYLVCDADNILEGWLDSLDQQFAEWEGREISK